MKYVLIVHEVEDYSKWKEGFDHATAIRKKAGEIDYKVLRDEGDPNKVVHFSKWVALDKAKEFFESTEIQELRAKLGVKSPEFIYLNQLESGVL